MIAYADMSPFETTFSYLSPEGETVYIAVDRLLARLKTHPRPVRVLKMSQEDADWVLGFGGVEPHRLARITETDLDRYPVVMLEFADTKQILVDGNHRFLAAWNIFKRDTISAYILKERYWHPFRVSGVPEHGLPPDELARQLMTKKSYLN